ncbi:sensor histidine kinase, partial [Streptomyces sp. NTH33]|uniref:sensor histidine kinase n=1 Tax=Streptomyces sp. NTH33 TaxID=1735453 RepID=UPI000DAA635E
MSPRALTAWWDRRSDPARIELYTRWTFYVFALAETVGIGGRAAFADAPAPVRAGSALLVTVHAGVVGLACSRALDWALDRRERPTGLLAAVAVLSVLPSVVAPALREVGALPGQEASALVVLGPLTVGLMPLALNLRPALRVSGLVVGACLLVGPPAVGTGASLWQATVLTATVLVAGFSLAFTARFSAWLLAAVWELDAARETQARLAVAEERLRFGRDLHDVLGRNLSVIALKSELAVQLSQRGSPAAVDQMVEVQRIARASQREVRDVVRGYRRADLHTELAGTRGVLLAAGIDCRIEDRGVRTLPEPVQSALGWVVREGTTNVLRHANARQCTLSLRIGSRAVLVMENDGVGPEPGSGATPSLSMTSTAR